MTEDEAFDKLYSAHFVRVRDFLRVYLGNAGVVEDVAQETFLQYWQMPQGFEPARSNLRTYLFGIARKKAADWWRQQKAEPAAEASCGSSDTALLMKDAFARLEPDSRNILWLREVEGHSYEELASILDVPIGTVKSRLFAAREQLRRIWKTS